MKITRALQRLSLSKSDIKDSLLRENGFLLKLFQQPSTLSKLKPMNKQTKLKKVQPTLLQNILTH